MIEGIDGKICKICNNLKLFKDFHKHPECKYGLKASCKSCLKERDANYRLTDNYKKSQLKYKSSQEWKDTYQRWKKNKRQSDPLFALQECISSSIKSSLNRKGFSKNKRSKEILGCDITEFKSYLESKFEKWMTWDNRGLYNGKLNYGWDIDHIIPISSATTLEEVLILNHYSNLQPLCSKINRDIKINKLHYDFK